MTTRIAAVVAMVTSATVVTVRSSCAQPNDTTPAHRRHQAIAYDPTTRRILLYGGQHLASETNAPMLDDLWSWDGARWTVIATHTGTAALAHKLFADGSGGVFATGGPRGATAKWNGQRWIPLSDDSTGRREMAAGAYDADRHRFVVVGGHIDGRVLPRDTREFDGQRWRVLTAAGPSPLIGAAMTYDKRRRVMVLFGGLDSAGRKLGATWELHGSEWTRVTTDGPPARFGAGIAYDAKRGVTVLFGGADSTDRRLDDTWLWDGRRWRRVDAATAPAPRSEGHLAYDEARAVVVMFGGEGVPTIPTLGDTWEWDGARWTKVR